MNQPVSSLNLPISSIAKLESAGFYYCNEIEATNDSKILPNIYNLTKCSKSKTARELYQEELDFPPIKTLIPGLDYLLQSELIPGCVTELCGFPGSGKTQICLHLAVGANSEVVFIHTNKNLNPQRLEEIAKTKGSEANLDKILCIEALDPIELMASVHFLESWLNEHKVKLLIIDNITWPAKQHPPPDRSSFIFSVFQNLRAMANTYNFPIVVTNNLTTKVRVGNISYTSSFGDSFYHLINNRILLTKEENTFKAKLLKSFNGSQHETTFQL